MIFKSRQVNLDPEPCYLAFDPSTRLSDGQAYWSSQTIVRDPRPEFEPTRDLFPWVDDIRDLGDAARYSRDWVELRTSIGLRWSPRRDQFDTPVNPILVAFRARLAYQRAVNPVSTARLAEVWLSNLPWYGGIPDATPEHITHARKVLSRLAAA